MSETTDFLTEALRKVRSLLEVEYHDDGRVACVAHASGGLREVVVILDAALTALPAKTVVEGLDETAWLIELHGNAPMWWSLDPSDEPAWTKNANKALRFARKIDAEYYIRDAGWTEAFPTEHMWPAHRPHDWFEFKGMKCCRSCGNVWNETSDTRQCKGTPSVGPRAVAPDEFWGSPEHERSRMLNRIAELEAALSAGTATPGGEK